MKNEDQIHIFWFRRDLRLDDNHGLYQALTSDLNVLPVFLFDKEILIRLEKNDKRVEFIWRELENMNKVLKKFNSAIQIYFDHPKNLFKKLVSKFKIHTVFANEDYEPYGISRDKEIQDFLKKNGILFKLCKDHVIFSPDEIIKQDETPYTIYTPYKKKWIEKLNNTDLIMYPSEIKMSKFFKTNSTEIKTIEQIGFTSSSFTFPPVLVEKNTLRNYDTNRDFPSIINGTSRLGIHLRFGTLSIRQLISQVSNYETFLNELVWREFFIQILFHFPQVITRSFKPTYDQIDWDNNESNFKAWCEGNTGYPLVDAGLRELNQTGHMHNRVRMVVASFLCKHLLIDWRWGEAYFAQKLLDYELASNNGNWQWAAGSGCDAAPYFRIFNPKAQLLKFDPEMKYVKKWIDQNESYPQEIVDHTLARERALRVYKAGLRSY